MLVSKNILSIYLEIYPLNEKLISVTLIFFNNPLILTTKKGGAAAENSTWTYPSPQMFYNALARKGKLNDTSEGEIESVVALHNNMNEKTWRKVLEWEQTMSNGKDDEKIGSKLLKFQGRPTDLSPKAAFKHYILGYPLPYDRHDWTVERPDGSVQRYVIDYYSDETRARDSPDTAFPNKDDENATPSLLVDVRPGLDDASSLWHRVVTMPVARHLSHSTTFDPLPMSPTPEMRSQVKESVAVWQSIQKNAAAKKTSLNTENAPAKYSQNEAKELASIFTTMKNDCKSAQILVDKCNTDEDCTRASLDLMICMGKIVCPLQHQALTKALVDDSDDSVTEAALGLVSDCISHKTVEHTMAKQQHPKIFA